MCRFVLLHFLAFLCLLGIADARLFFPDLSADTWQLHDGCVSGLLRPAREALNSRSAGAKVSSDSFSSTLCGYLRSNHSFVKDVKQDRRRKSVSDASVEAARKEKNRLKKVARRRGSTPQDRRAFYGAIRSHSHLKRIHEQVQRDKDATFQERSYLRNFYNFAKEAVAGAIGGGGDSPQFPVEVANRYYPEKYQVPVRLQQGPLSWFPYLPEDKFGHAFDMSPITPSLVRKVLSSKKATSAPGPDELMYGVLLRLPSTHSFLATLFSRLLLDDPDPTAEWCQSEIKLIYKDGDKNDPANFRPISLTSCVGKIYHQILADRMALYLSSNGLIDTTVQKAFMRGISGCTDHNLVLQELLAFAREKKKTLHCTFFDLADAFGSVSHDLIKISLERFKFPPQIVSYFVNVYSQLNGSVLTKDWRSENFRFEKGVFQGDPSSPIIFLACFNPILEKLESLRLQKGFDHQGLRHITLPFADDFNLLTHHKVTHQNIINEIMSWTTSMGLVLKPRKCKSLSIKAGCSAVVEFKLGDYTMASIKDDPYMKFLGAYITYKGKGVPGLIKEKMECGLKNIDKCLVRDERKVRIYKEYFLPANRFILSIHDLTKTDLGKLDALANRYLKSWLGMPQGGSFLPVHSGLGMDVKSVSHLYKESRSLDIVRALIRGDHTVQTTVQAKVQREQKWTRKSAISVRAAEIAGTILSSTEPAIGNVAVVEPPLVIHDAQPQDPQPPQSPLHAPPGDLDLPLHPHPIVEPGPQPPQVEPIPTQVDTVPKVSAIRREVKRVFQEEEDEAWAARVSEYTMQGNLFALLQAENESITWKSYMWDLPRGVLKFAVNSSIDTLPTFTNLRRWGKRASVNCQLCGNMVKQTLFHVLVHCKHTLDQGRLTWRHDSVLNHIAGSLKSALVGKSTVELYCDLDGLQAPGGGSIPADVMVQAQRPDLVIVDRSEYGRFRIALVELTCPWDTDAKKAEERKTARYADLREELSNQGWDCSLYLIEVGARGHIVKSVKDRLRSLFRAWLPAGHRSGIGQMIKDVSRISLVCSFAIFQARNDPVWFSPRLVTRHIDGVPTGE